MTIDFSFAWLDESAWCWISFGPCEIGCCLAVTVHEYFPVPDVANGCHIQVSVLNSHGFYLGVVAAYSMQEAEALLYVRLEGSGKVLFQWLLQEEIIAAKQALINYEFENGAE